MTSRHHYTIPGASLIRSRRDSTTPTQTQRPALNNTTTTSTARDTRQPAAPPTNSVRNRVAPDVASSSKPLPSTRPPSVMGYPTQAPSGYPTTSRPPPPQRPPSVYGPSSSKTRVEASDSRNVFSKMFSRKTTLAPPQSDERGRGMDKDSRQRSSSRQPASRSASVQPPATTNPLVRETSKDEWARQRAKKEKEERDREREREREREERKRAEYAVYKARQEEVAKQAAPTTRPATAAPRDRSISRAGREYESDAVRRRPAGSSRPETRRSSQFLFPPASSIANQGSKDSQTRHPQHPPQTQPAGVQQVASVQPPLSRPHGVGVPVQDSNSSQSTTASQRVQNQPVRHLQSQNSESKHPSPAGASIRSVAHTPAQVAARAPSSSPEERQRIIADAMEREREKERQALARRDREHREAAAVRERETREREAAAAREREAREREAAAAREREATMAREREAVIAREKERERERELVRQREAELLEHERRQKELERERRRVARRAERERMKEQERQHERQERLRENERQRELERLEAERLERERQEKAEQVRLRELERQKAIELAERREQERVEREMQKEAERLEKERKEAERQERLREQERLEREREKMKDLEREKVQQQEAAEKQREAERTVRERQESERAEKERIKIERTQRELERMERERKEKERDRAHRAAARQRGQRDKTQSSPANYLPAATTVSDAEKLLRQGRHRSQSQPVSAAPQMQSFAIPTELQIPEVSENRAQPVLQPDVEADDLDEESSSEDGMESPVPLPIPPPTMERDHVLYPRSGNATVPPGPHRLSALPDQVPRLEPSAVPVKRYESTDTLLGDNITSAWTQPPLGANPSRRVSIFASQGPPDRSQYKNGQRRASFHPDSSFGTSRVRANAQPPAQNGDTHNSAAQFYETGEKSTPQGSATSGPSGQLQLPPSASGRHSMIFPQPKHFSDPPEYSTPGHYDQLEDDALFPRTRAEDNFSEFDIRTQDQMAGLKFNADRQSGRPQMAKAASAYSQYAVSIKKQPDSNAPELLDTSNNIMQRAGSDNSTRRQSLQAHAAPVGNSIAALPVSRTASDASQSTEKGSASHKPPPLLIPPAMGLSSSQQAPLSSSGQTFTSASRIPLESAKSPQSNAFPPSHTHSHSVPSTASTYPYSVPAENRIASSRQDNASGSRNPATRASTSILQLPNGYPAYQQASTQDSKLNYTPSSNVSYPVQTPPAPHSQQPLSTNQPYAMHSHMPSTQIPSSHAASDMLSPQNVNQPSSSHMYHTSLEFRTTPHPTPTQAQHSAPLHTIPSVNHTASQESATRMAQAIPARKDDSPVPDHRNDHQESVLDGSEPRINSTLLKVPDLKQQPPSLPLTPTSRAMAPSLPGRPRSSAEHSQRASSQPPTPAQISKPTATLQSSDSPPGLTPSSSKESLDEVLMTPASLNNGRVQAQASSSTDTLQRAEKKKGGFFGMFRSSSKQGKERERTRDKESGEKEDLKRVNVKAEVRAYEAKTPTPGPSQSQNRTRPESLFRGKRARPASIMEVFAQQPSHSTKPTKASKTVPPPIHIPLDPQRYRLVSNKTKHYRSVSVASQEALDGTANNTVVGSPQSSRRSPTLSGPLTPSIRDPVEAADTWRQVEESFVDHGSTRRRRPGVTFDLMGEDAQKDGAEYRARRTRRQRRDSPM